MFVQDRGSFDGQRMMQLSSLIAKESDQVGPSEKTGTRYGLHAGPDTSDHLECSKESALSFCFWLFELELKGSVRLARPAD
jgi:hypothetical protein